MYYNTISFVCIDLQSWQNPMCDAQGSHFYSGKRSCSNDGGKNIEEWYFPLELKKRAQNMDASSINQIIDYSHLQLGLVILLFRSVMDFK